ncbi:FAD-binding oxidoreductase, partial [candidate division KSB1 bacterium]|nr:FAD-binding oxidoreductase [candidate division KSB1 bacterium]
LWLKKKCVIWQDIPGLKLMQKIKKQLDPDNILNPDRFITFS